MVEDERQKKAIAKDNKKLKVVRAPAKAGPHKGTDFYWIETEIFGNKVRCKIGDWPADIPAAQRLAERTEAFIKEGGCPFRVVLQFNGRDVMGGQQQLL